MKLLNLFHKSQQAVSIAHAPEMDLEEQVLAGVNGGGHNCYHPHRDCDDHRRHEDCHYRRHNDCHRPHCH
ncbi:hypothetical protein KDH_05980 [Dictyobacter sp. S3.2.2.5]|uniref:Uncharacterized protein n=1 Tax=Dictyobacter halimunensis TaxID=3026934 RepID=A0ABQ6FI14_9CHLR|nr:hypothetical protein KDH_05980 [Dictyobacter sp. S3.2.2.5]